MQVTRVISVDLKAGEAEVVLKSLSKCLDKDSVRVDGIGPASITEVSFQVGYAQPEVLKHSFTMVYTCMPTHRSVCFNYVIMWYDVIP